MNGFFPFYGEAICLSTIHLPTYIYIYLVLNSDPKEIHRGKKTLKWKSKGQNPNILPHHCTMDTSNFKSGRF